MGSTYKTDFNVFNGTDYDRHYFSTTADQVKTKRGVSVQDMFDGEKVFFECGCFLSSQLSKLYDSCDLPQGWSSENCHIVSVMMEEATVDGWVMCPSLTEKYADQFTFYLSGNKFHAQATKWFGEASFRVLIVNTKYLTNAVG